MQGPKREYIANVQAVHTAVNHICTGIDVYVFVQGAAKIDNLKPRLHKASPGLHGMQPRLCPVQPEACTVQPRVLTSCELLRRHPRPVLSIGNGTLCKKQSMVQG